MPPKKCSDNVPENQQETPYKCLRKGIAVGKNLSVKIDMDLSKDVLREIAKRNDVRGYSNMTKIQLFEALEQKGVRRFKPFDIFQ